MKTLRIALGFLICVLALAQQPDAGSNLRYTATATGAVERSVESRLADRISVMDFAATGDGVADDTTEIQAAIDGCSEANPGVGPGEVYFPGGKYRISATINWKNCSLIGVFPQRTIIYWDGATDIPAFLKDVASGLDGENIVAMRNLRMEPGTATPETWVEFTGNEYVDKFTRLEELHFIGGTTAAILLDSTSFANIHWNNLRFDSVDGYAIKFNINGAANGNNFNLDNFTYDNNGGTTGGLGVFAFDNVADTSFAMTARIANGRIEANDDFSASGNKSLINFLTSGATKVNCTFMSLQLENIYYQNVVGGASHYPFYHDTACTGGTASTPIFMRNVGLQGIAGVFAGKNYLYNSVFSTASSQNYADATFGSWLRLDTQESEFVGYETTAKAVTVRGRLDTGPRYWAAANGSQNWADGAGGAVDTTVNRISAGLFGVTLGNFYFQDSPGAAQGGGVVKVQQNGMYVQRAGVAAHSEQGGLALVAGAGSTDPERACVGSGAVTDCGTFTPIAEQAAFVQFNTGDHATYGSNVVLLVDDGLTPNLGAYAAGLTYTPKASFRAQDLAGVRTVEVGADISTGPKLTMNALGATITGHAYASLGAPAAGTVIWCTDCAVTTPCSASGSGAWAFRVAGPAWDCSFQEGASSLASIAETSAGTEAAKSVTPDSLAGSIYGERIIEMAVFDWAVNTATGDGKHYYYVPAALNGFNIVAVDAQVITAGTTGTLNVDLARCAVVATGNVCSGTVVDVLSTNLTIDTGEDDSGTAEAAAVISETYDDLATGQVIRVDVDAVHSTPAQGLIVTLTLRKP